MEQKKRKLSERAESALAMLQAIESDEERRKALVSTKFLAKSEDWPDSELFSFYDVAIEELSHNSLEQNLLMFCDSLMKAKSLFRGTMPIRLADYLVNRLNKLVEDWQSDESPHHHPLDVLGVVKWVYERTAGTLSIGKANQLVRLCGVTLDLFWVDNYCRRHIDSSVKWQRQFRGLLANGMIDRGEGDEGFWDTWNISSGCRLDQSNPEHYSREGLLRDRLTTLKTRGMIAFPEGLLLAKLWINELAHLRGRNVAVDFLSLNGWPPEIQPES